MMYSLLSIVQGWCPWCGDHMSGWGGWLMMFGWWLIPILLIIGVLWVFRSGGPWRGGGPSARGSAEDTLREQYARGEIDEETYRRRLDELRRR